MRGEGWAFLGASKTPVAPRPRWFNRSSVDGAGPPWSSGNVHHLKVYEGHAFDFPNPLSQLVKIQQAARAVRARRSNGEVDFTVFGDVHALNDVEFGVRANIVGVFPRGEQSGNASLKRNVLSAAHGEPSIVVVHQGFGFVQVQFGQSPFHFVQFALATLEQGRALFKHGQRFVEVFSTSFQLAHQFFQAS
jgi:hypothetical protein